MGVIGWGKEKAYMVYTSSAYGLGLYFVYTYFRGRHIGFMGRHIGLCKLGTDLPGIPAAEVPPKKPWSRRKTHMVVGGIGLLIVLYIFEPIAAHRESKRIEQEAIETEQKQVKLMEQHQRNLEQLRIQKLAESKAK